MAKNEFTLNDLITSINETLDGGKVLGRDLTYSALERLKEYELHQEMARKAADSVLRESEAAKEKNVELDAENESLRRQLRELENGLTCIPAGTIGLLNSGVGRHTDRVLRHARKYIFREHFGSIWREFYMQLVRPVVQTLESNTQPSWDELANGADKMLSAYQVRFYPGRDLLAEINQEHDELEAQKKNFAQAKGKDDEQAG